MSKKSFNRSPNYYASTFLEGFHLRRLRLLAAFGLLAWLGSDLTLHPETPLSDPILKSATQWEGIEATVWEIHRLPDNRLLFQIAFDNLSKKTALLAVNIRQVKKPGINGQPGKDEMEFDPYDISRGAVLIDETSGIEYKAIPGSPAPAGFGFRGGDGTLLNVIFPCPAPPQQEPGSPPAKQMISIQLPQVSLPFRHLTIPMGENGVAKFHP